MVTAGLSAALAIAALPSAAAPMYQFNVLSITCQSPGPACELDYWTRALNSLTVSLRDFNGAFVNSWSRDWGGPGPYEAGYSGYGISEVDVSAFGARLDPTDGFCRTVERCRVEGGFSGEWKLSGSLIVASIVSDLNMTSAGSDLWTGYLTSDYPMTGTDTTPMFTGEWLRVPEPSPVALIGAGLAGLMFMRRREDMRRRPLR